MPSAASFFATIGAILMPQRDIWVPRCVLRAVQLVDGTRQHGVVMTRIVDGKREYRAATQDEVSEHHADNAW